MLDMTDGPKLYTIILHPKAFGDLDDIAERIERDIGEQTAVRYLDEVQASCRKLDLFPHIGRRLPAGKLKDVEIRMTPNHDRRYSIVIGIYETLRVVQIGYVWGGGTTPPVTRFKDGPIGQPLDDDA